MRKVKLIVADTCSVQVDALETISYSDPSVAHVLSSIEDFKSVLLKNPYAKIGVRHHRLFHSGPRKGSYACGFPNTGESGLHLYRFVCYVFEKKKGSWVGSVPDFVEGHLSPEDLALYDYIVFVQDVFWDYHDSSRDADRLKNRDSGLQYEVLN